MARLATQTLDCTTVSVRDQLPVVALRMEDKLDYSERGVASDFAVWENRVRLSSMPTTWVRRSLLRKCQSRLFHHVGGMDDIKCEAVRCGNKGTPTGAARQARAPQCFQLEPAHREHYRLVEPPFSFSPAEQRRHPCPEEIKASRRLEPLFALSCCA